MKKRYVIYICLLLLIGQSVFLTPVLPVIQLPGEAIVRWSEGSALKGLFGEGFTNTFLATLITFVILLIWAISLRAPSRTADEIPTGLYNFWEMLIELAYGYVESAAGKWAKSFFPFFLTFILWIVVANWMELVPMVDAVGKWETFGELELHRAEAAGEHDEEVLHEIEEEAMEANLGDFRRGIFLLRAPAGEEGEKPEDADWTIVPFVRAASTDLNFTIALAIVSVVMTQYYGMRALGLSYWKKFFVWEADKIASNPLAILDPVVGILEFISEIFKIVSFAFRLLGNIFAGQVLLFVIGALLPVGNLLFWHLEFAVGILQAAVFALLTLTFMSSAVAGHHGEEEHH